jgi:hypothetical protein
MRGSHSIIMSSRKSAVGGLFLVAALLAPIVGAAPASADTTRTSSPPVTTAVATPKATLAANHKSVSVNLDRKYRRNVIAVKVKVKTRYVLIGKLTLNRSGDGRLSVPTARVAAMKAGLPVRFLKAGNRIGATTLKVAASIVTPTPTPTVPVAPPVPDVSSQDFSGMGDQVVPLSVAALRPALVSVMGVGSSNLIVWAVDSAGTKYQLLVNEIGNYSGTVLMNMPTTGSIYGFEVTASGMSWTIQVRPLSSAASWTSGSTTGTGSTVLSVGSVSTLTTLALSHVGTSNFIVWAYDANGRRIDLLVNEIGNYSGSVLMPLATRYLGITADGGSWSAAR